MQNNLELKCRGKIHKFSSMGGALYEGLEIPNGAAANAGKFENAMQFQIQ
jgi:hypothetical protein